MAIALGGALLVVLGLILLLKLPKACVATRSVRTRGTPEQVWRTLLDPGQSLWRPDVQSILAPKAVISVEKLSTSKIDATWTEVLKDGSRLAVKTRDQTPPSKLVRERKDSLERFVSVWEFDIAPDTLGTRVMLTDHRTFKSLLPRILTRVNKRHAREVEKYLEALASHLGAASQVNRPKPTVFLDGN